MFQRMVDGARRLGAGHEQLGTTCDYRSPGDLTLGQPRIKPLALLVTDNETPSGQVRRRRPIFPARLGCLEGANGSALGNSRPSTLSEGIE